MSKSDNGDEAAAFYEKRTKWAEFISTNPEVSDRAFRVGYWLSRRMNGEDQCCWFSIEQIAQRMGKKHRTVASAIADLRAANVIIVVEERGRTNTYYLHAPFF
jgi:DNA-binding transcriptional ArsR family regulator